MLPSGPGAGSEKRCVLVVAEICRVNYLWFGICLCIICSQKIIALIISWSTLRTDSISQTDQKVWRVNNLRFEDSGGVVSTIADDGLTYMNEPAIGQLDARLKIIAIAIQEISVYSDVMYITCSVCRNCASNNNVYKKFCVICDVETS